MKILVSIFLILSLYGCSAPQGDAEFDTLKNQYIEEYFQIFPEYGLYSGRYEFASKMSVNDEAQRDSLIQFANTYLAALNNYDYKTLNNTNASDWLIMENDLNSLIWYIEALKPHQWNPSQYNIASPVGLILNTEYTSLEERLRAISERLKLVPTYYSSAISSVQLPTLPHTKIAIQQNKGAKELLETRLQQTIEKSALTQEEIIKFTAINAEAVAAIDGYINWLEVTLSEIEKTGSKDFRIGEKLYEEKFGFDIVSGYTAKEIYQLALKEKDRLHQDMIKQSKLIWSKYFPNQAFPKESLKGVNQLIGEIAKHHAKQSEFVESVRKQIPELEAFILEKDLIDVDPEKPLVVRETPAYQRGFSIASIESPGPYDSAANTYYNVQPIDDYSEEDAASHLREYNHYMMQILNIHEAIPGHYTQLVHANKSPSLIKSLFGNGAMIEGWAVYTERMMLEQGYGDNSPELWLMYYKWNLRTVVNTILDYSIQVLGMEEAAALDLLMNQAFQEKAEATGKWRRATLSQVQLTSYFTGYKEIYEFRETMKQKLVDKFSLKAFHNKFLSYGNAPVKSIKSLMLDDLEK